MHTSVSYTDTTSYINMRRNCLLRGPVKHQVFEASADVALSPSKHKAAADRRQRPFNGIVNPTWHLVFGRASCERINPDAFPFHGTPLEKRRPPKLPRHPHRPPRPPRRMRGNGRGSLAAACHGWTPGPMSVGISDSRGGGGQDVVEWFVVGSCRKADPKAVRCRHRCRPKRGNRPTALIRTRCRGKTRTSQRSYLELLFLSTCLGSSPSSHGRSSPNLSRRLDQPSSRQLTDHGQWGPGLKRSSTG
ncbi:hypothetical protein LZ30DRAFT_240492 [Colletotrichum cereale]|nr:hypothetical protein LZ30DRAFT_240492 [Colletotrichum cereale]